MPHEILKESSVYKELKTLDQRRDESVYKDTECKHNFWSKKCGFCNTILESECQHNLTPGESSRVSYGELDMLVCTYVVAQKLQNARVTQRSKLYWVYRVDNNVLSLRCKSNVTLKNTKVVAAFTSSELIKCLYRLPSHILTPDVFEYMGRQAHDPNRLGRLLLKYAKHLKEETDIYSEIEAHKEELEAETVEV